VCVFVCEWDKYNIVQINKQNINIRTL